MTLIQLGASICAALILCCAVTKGTAMEPSFAEDVALMRKHFDVIVISQGNARVAVAPSLQGRVMTSSADGDNGQGFGWINREFIAAGKTVPQINVYGGEDRFWLGPEGGQFSIFFTKGAAFEFKNWQTPALIDTEPFAVVEKGPQDVSFRKKAAITNYSGTQFNIEIERAVHLYPDAQISDSLATEIPAGVKCVAYFTSNYLWNRSDKPWSKDTGLLSIWILGMFKPGPQTTVVIPFKDGSDVERGPKVIDDYFGKVPADRLVVRENVLFFSGDGKYRSKIGLTPKRAMHRMGSYDAAAGVLTIVLYNSAPQYATDFVNSKWEIQKQPFAGDVVNSYNDGPASPGAKPLGPFYELESSSPVSELRPGEKIEHYHNTFHLKGSEADLDPIARNMLGVSIAEIKSALPRQK